MTHGTPDWGVTAGRVTTYQLTDLAELAVRLGSIVTHDRRGDVIALDGFEAGLAKWNMGFSGDGGAADLSVARAKSGLYSVRLRSGSTGSHYADMLQTFSYPALSSLGVEYSFSLGPNQDHLDLIVTHFDGANVMTTTIRWDNASDELRYLDDGGSYVALATGIDLGITDTTFFHTLKVVIDPTAHEYVRVIFDDAEYPLPMAAQVDTNSAAPQLAVTIRNTGLDGYNGLVYVDDVIVTQNEPT